MIEYGRYEFEFTSRCNAECPGCRRTFEKQQGILPLVDMSFSRIQQVFDSRDMEGHHAYFCGIMGDPCVHPEFEDILEYFVYKNLSKMKIHTNGGMRKPEWWVKIAQLSRIAEANGQYLYTQFNVDGGPKTNHLYRVNVKWDRVWKNMKAYFDAGGVGGWTLIEFDWNKEEIEWCKNLAEEHNIPFNVRRAYKNEQERNFKREFEDYMKEEVDLGPEYLSCKHRGDTTDPNKKLPNEVYIRFDGKVFPCCYLNDESRKYKNSEWHNIYNIYGENFNSLDHYTLDEILNHELFQGGMSKCWEKGSNQFLSRCYATCGKKGERLNTYV